MQAKKTHLNQAAVAFLFVLTGAYIGLLLWLCADNCFWGDECYTILKVNGAKSFYEVATCDSLTNPPLYFLIFKGITLLLGCTPWVYHFVSAVPFILLAMLNVFSVRKHFGTLAGFLFLLILLIPPHVLDYSLEIRMYSWAAFFVVLCCFEGYMLLSSKGAKNGIWIRFCLAGIAAAYTHYFAFAAVILIYLLVFGKLIYINRTNLRKSLLAIIGSIVCFLPWIGVFFSSVSEVNGDFWIGNILTVWEGFDYIFENYLVLALYLATVAVISIYFYRYVWFRRIGKTIHLKLNPEPSYKDDTSTWMLLSIFIAVTFVLLFQMVYAVIVRPVFVERYIFPAGMALWASFALSVGTIPNNRVRKVCGAAFIVIMMLAYGIGLPGHVQANMEDDRGTKSVCDLVTESGKAEETYILTDHPHLAWTVLDYYFPDSQNEAFSETKEYNFRETGIRTVWLFMQNRMDENQITDIQKKIGAKPEYIDSKTFAGSYYSHIYQATITP